ncbi:MAG: ABC transporter ATP-binding protein [Anaerolineales bacterium]|nr:ABC transporter ATP-binding protein [Anaerolineales bacterium]MBP6210886.1 ABC transporter ATP-binding protein [Anaerolineales bacterium]MBP8164774.1 ABC transporter ATP-binding protein [Anaerolineales bacterium]
MSPIIEIKQLTKRFKKRIAVNNINFNIENGEIFGLVGPNGAGKTTTMRMLVTLLKPDQGEIFVGGYSILKQANDVRRQIGFMPDSFGVYGDMTVNEYLDFFGACYKIHPHRRAQLISDLLDLVDLGHRRDDMVDTLSTGLKQRLGLARVLIHDPGILVLDEPASGLDPRARVEIRELLLEVARLGKTILFSSHILADVGELCSRVGIIEDGKMAALGTLQQLSQHVMPHRQIHIELLSRSEDAQAALRSMPGVAEVRVVENSNRASLDVDFIGDDESIHQLLAKLLAEGFPVVHFSEDSKNLEEVFMRTTKGIVS